MPTYVRVSWKATKHESSIPEHRFNEARHKRLEKPAVDRHGDPLPAKTHVRVKAATPKNTPDATTAPEETSGLSADTQEGES